MIDVPLSRTFLRNLLAGAVALVSVAAVSATTVGSAPDARAAAPSARTTYTNPVSAPVADTYADPAVIKGKDGWWYAFATSDPLREGDTAFAYLPISRSRDLVNWEYVGQVFDSGRPSWATSRSFFWAPDIRYLDGRYVVYYTVTDTTLNPGDDSAIGVATAPTPAGPWTHSDAPVVAPRPGPFGGFMWTFDPSQLTDTAGRKWLYYGSYFGGIHVVQLTPDGLRATGPATMVAIDNRYEGAYVVRRGGWYYLFASAANCCAGPTTGYSVFVGRSASPTGPFVDRDGVSLRTSRVGGTPVIQPNGNIWVGPGHNAIATDVTGQDWFVYHAIDRRDPFLTEPYGINERPMLIDRLDWIGGWPTVRAGAWASEGPQPGPVTAGVVDDQFERATLGGSWQASSGRWEITTIGESGGAVRHTASSTDLLISSTRVPHDVRIEADLRVTSADGAAGLVARYRSPGDYASARIDRRAGALITDVVSRGRHSEQAVALPAGFSYDAWHTLTIEIRGKAMTVTVTDARLGDPVAEATRWLPGAVSGNQAGLLARGAAAADNVVAARSARLVTRAVATPRVGHLDPAYSDEFDGSAVDPGWTWVRPDPDAVVADGVLRWPTQAADLVGTSNSAAVLLRDAPEGEYVVETKLTIDLGVDTVRNYQQAGLIAYVNDDDFARLSHVAIWNTRQIEYGRELPFAGRLSFGGMVLGPPADTTWLRLAHHVDRATGEHRLRAASSRDGVNWVWGGTWTFPAGAAPRIGLVSQGGDNPQATAQFDYVRFYRP